MQKFLLLLSLALFISCQGNKKDGTNGQTTQSGSKYTTLPADQYSDLFKKVTNIDFIAYTTNLSMSFDEPNSVRTILQYISKEATTIPDHCEKTVRVTFISDGAIFTEADVYAYDGCSAFVFYKDGAPAYANQIDPVGIEFFQRYIPKDGPEEVPVQ